jgi:hypothetical protein
MHGVSVDRLNFDFFIILEDGFGHHRTRCHDVPIRKDQP